MRRAAWAVALLITCTTASCGDGDGGEPDASVDAGREDAGRFDDVAWPALDEAARDEALAPREGVIEVVIDTDLGNEIDDQFAVVHALLAPERLDVRAIHAAPWGISGELITSPAFTSVLDARLLREQLAERGVDPASFPTIRPSIGMSRAFDEATEITALLGRDVPVFHGAGRYLGTDPLAPVASEATESLIALAREPRDGPLYVLALGAITNVASALLLAPDLVEHIVVVWASAYPSFWPSPNASYNLAQDVAAARVVLASGVPFVYVPGFFVAEELRVTRPEIAANVEGAGALREYLFTLYENHPIDGDHFAGRSKVLWDMAVTAWALDPAWTESALVATPSLDETLRWSPRAGAPVMREVRDLHRDGVMRDFYARLAATDP
ncbi:MAG: nucleoside hydrolase [Sandaracinaceae bacterium]